MNGGELSECREPGEARQRSSVPKLRKCRWLFIEKGAPAVSVSRVVKERGKSVARAKIVYAAPARGFTKGSIKR